LAVREPLGVEEAVLGRQDEVGADALARL